VTDDAVILLVEDREDDVLLIKKSFERAHLTNPVQVARDGDEAIAYLSGEGEFGNRADNPLPILILLDLKMPKVGGFEVLSWVRKQEELRAIPVIVLTCSDQIRDVNKAYELGANSFLVKPLDFENYIELSKLLRQYWLKTVVVTTPVRPPRENTEAFWR
jgi:CheY-like chemotaxis protein